jgi:hypothetical protein
MECRACGGRGRMDSGPAGARGRFCAGPGGAIGPGESPDRRGRSFAGGPLFAACATPRDDRLSRSTLSFVRHNWEQAPDGVLPNVSVGIVHWRFDTRTARRIMIGCLNDSSIFSLAVTSG